jgi:3,4-dihydroxy 2-butanone 4-phosphate synthase / GTP cyclohydrolase II
MTTTNDNASLRNILNPQALEQYAREAYTFVAGQSMQHPVHGTTLYLAHTDVPTRFGNFQAHIFQDLIHKGYVIALIYGDVWEGGEVYTRMHSSCVTSETLGGCDCDCVQQLERAMQVIAGKGKGVLFYLLQEGRGVGYCAKARDRMLVQASGDTLSTFDAYRLLGLKKDYRTYLNIADIIKILGIQASWVLLTNNPDKVEGMKQHGLEVLRTEALEFDPSPFNQFYLHSKRESGHVLTRTEQGGLPNIPTPESIEPFKPARLRESERFIYMASYYLPIQAIDNEIIIDYDQLRRLIGEQSLDRIIEGPNAPVLRYTSLRGNRLALHLNPAAMDALAVTDPTNPLLQLRHYPYWFRVHVYFDVASGDDCVLLTYGKAQSFDSPVVRVQSESIFNRFPVKVDTNKAKYQRAVQHIVHYGCGAIVLVHQDGRGAGFGAFALDRMLLEQGKTRTTEESYRRLGVPFDQRDYTGLFDILRSHLPGKSIQMVMNSPNSLVLKSEYAHALNSSGLNVVNWIFLESELS